MNEPKKTVVCSFCDQKRDTYISFKPSSRSALDEKVYICKGCHDKAGEVFERKYKKVEKTIVEDSTSAWSTATWDSD